MSKSSRARRKQQLDLSSSGAPNRIGAMRPPPNLTMSLAMAAEGAYEGGAASSAVSSSPPSGGDSMPAGDPVRARMPVEAEDHFFARGEAIASLRPSEFDIIDEDAEDTSNRLSVELIVRRARMRRIVSGVVGGAAMLTVIVVTKTWLTRPSASAISESSLTFSGTIVPSIAMTTQPELATPPVPAAPPVAPSLPAAAQPAAESQA